METVLDTSREWLWAIDDRGNFTFSSRTSSTLLGYDPAELLGRPISMVIDQDDLTSSRQSVAGALGDRGSDWAGVVVSCRHRNGAPVWMEVSGKSRQDRDGRSTGFEGTSRLLPAQTVRTLLKERVRERIDKTVQSQMILTAFQPIYDLPTGTITGVEALARFPTEDSRGPDHWFNEATSVGLGGELEFAALEAALHNTAKLPEHLYVALNLSPETCLDPRLPGFWEESALAVDRIVLELTERLAVDEYAPLLAALGPLRRRSLRIAVDDAGSGFSSMRHILQLRPDIIKLDRSLIAGIDSPPGPTRPRCGDGRIRQTNRRQDRGRRNRNPGRTHRRHPSRHDLRAGLLSWASHNPGERLGGLAQGPHQRLQRALTGPNPNASDRCCRRRLSYAA
ncbi:PAS domain S-box-containing protein [Arthrobacter pascens]|uniref:sensor domain-containing phosphodiesterase n=1 Tax=Arthrobacter pascens TaxID=1677 RepID=UPI002791C62C|nr:EAL domain-containing protein [Arthrobacter pascens]MDQ0677311.1 PAS domain S-box-containing protein [Arthrobacter pascens]